MKPERWRQVDRIFNEALNRAAGERTQFIEKACADDAELQESVESLLACHDQAGNFLEAGAMQAASSLRKTIDAGTRFGPYEILALIGEGGMGAVYKAHDTRLGRDVAVKVLRRVVSDGAAWERFEREARAASALTHPNICTVHDVGEADGQPYLVMELLEGVTLSAQVSEQPLETGAALTIAMQIAEALEAAHAKGIIHRDIKPANVMISGRWRVKVLDFGLAKQTAIGENLNVHTKDTVSIVGTVMGTPPYLSPEVLQGAPADARSDLWAFGVVLYQMLTGRLPFTGATVFEMGSAILKEPAHPLPTNVPVATSSIVERCLAKRPEERFQSAGEVRSALEAIQTHAMTASGINRRTWLLVAGTAAISTAGVLWWLRREEPVPAAVPLSPTLSTGGPPSKNPEANELFETAMHQERELTDIPQSQQTLEQALQIDQDFAEAHRYHAFEYVLLLLNGFSNDRAVLSKAEEELRLVEKLSPDLASLPGAWTALYLAQGHKDRIDVAKLDRLIKERLDVPTNKNWRMIMNIFAENNEEAKQEASELLAAKKTFAAPRLYLGDVKRREGDIQGAIQEQKWILEHASSNMPAIRYLTLAYMDNGELEKARNLLVEKRDLSKNFLLRMAWALLYAVDGKPKEAHEAMDEETKEFARATFTVTSEVAEFYAVLGDTSNAIRWLQIAVNNGDERSDWFVKDKRLEKIHNDPEFIRIIDNINSNKARRKQQSNLAHN